jgi:hypothetical protein
MHNRKRKGSLYLNKAYVWGRKWTIADVDCRANDRQTSLSLRRRARRGKRSAASNSVKMAQAGLREGMEEKRWKTKKIRSEARRMEEMGWIARRRRQVLWPVTYVVPNATRDKSRNVLRSKA